MVATPLAAGSPLRAGAATMRAAVFHGPGQPLRLEEVPLPEPGPGEVRVRVAACGVCHTDLHYVDHGTPTFKEPPLILGHEASGRVDALGPGVSGWTAGEPVLLPAVLTCGSCRFCRLGRENVCAEMRMFGNHVDGAYAEHVLAPARDLFRLPPAIPLEEGCIIADALSTPYHAVKNRGQVRPGEAFFSQELGEFILPYDAVRTAADPKGTLMAFLQSTYEAAAELGRWDRAALECERGEPRRVRPGSVKSGARSTSPLLAIAKTGRLQPCRERAPTCRNRTISCRCRGTPSTCSSPSPIASVTATPSCRTSPNAPAAASA